MSAISTVIDPITVEIVRNALLACAQEMKIDLRRTSYNPIINEMNDFSVGIFSARAETVAQAPGLPEFVCDIPSAIHSIADDIGGMDSFKEGDLYLTNDPYANTFHVHDVNTVKPMFYNGKLIGFSGARAHWHDIGGASAGGNLTATDVFQEGVIYKSIALYRGGVLNTDVMRLIEANTRLPATVLGDLRAQVGSCNVGDLRVQAVIRRYGLEVYEGCLEQILNDGESQAIEALSRVPNGVYSAESCIDNDGVDLDVALPVRATVTKTENHLVIDVTGSAEYCRGPMNCNSNTTRSVCRLVFKMLTTPNEAANEGHFRMVDLVVPDRSIFNARRPAATLPGFFALEALEDVVKRALAEAMPNSVNADDYGRCTPAHIKFKASDGEYRILADTEGGGWGANAFDDGESAMLFGEIRTIPIEIMEARYPVQLRRYTLRNGSGGPGRYRGGLGIIKEYECLIHAQLNAGLDRQVCPPQGVLGGHQAVANRVVIESVDGQQKTLPSKVTDYPVQRGEIISLQTAGGGGYGDPLDRPLDQIEEDLRQGYEASISQLADEYGVVVQQERNTGRWFVNRAASDQRRNQLRAVR